MEPTSIQQEVSKEQITDVRDFFSSIISDYIQLEQNIIALQSKLQTSSPDKIFQECSLLLDQKQKLSQSDSQLIEIMDLAGSEIVHLAFIEQYKDAFAKVRNACNSLYLEMKQLKRVIHQDI